jgi:hypothetical protein
VDRTAPEAAVLHAALLVPHIVAGSLGLAAGIAAGFMPKQVGWHTLLGWTYQTCCAVLCLSALGLVVLDSSLWGFALIAVGTELCAAGSVVVRRRRRPGWIPLHANLVLSSYVSFVTALVVQTIGGWAWVVPVVVGSAVISVVVGRLTARERRRPTGRPTERPQQAPRAA